MVTGPAKRPRGRPRARVANSEKVKLIFATTMWGGHLDLFIHYCIPCILNQIKDLNGEYDLEYWFFMGEGEIKYLREFPVWEEFSSYFRKQILSSNKNVHDNYREALRRSHEQGGVLRLISPDVINSEGSLRFGLEKIKEGFKGVAVPTGALRINQEKTPLLKDYSEKNMVKLFLDNLHQETRQHFVDSDRFFIKPVMKIRRDGKGIMVNSFYYEPFLIDCRGRNFEYTDIELNLFNKEDQVYFPHDSGEIFELSLSPADRLEPPSNSYSEEKIRDWGRYLKATDFNWKIYDQGYFIRVE